MIIDLHTHCFPDKIAKLAIESLELSSNTKAVLNGSVTALSEASQKAGVDINVIMPIATKPAQTPTINRAAIENNKRKGFMSFGSVHPDYEDWRGELQRIRDAGLKGIKLHPDFQDMFIDDPKMVAVMAEAAELGLIVTIHGGVDVSYLDVHHSTPKRLYKVLPQLKGAKIIVAHSGGYQYLDDVKKYLVGIDEVYIDTSYSLGFMEEDKLREVYMSMNPEHIVFGTDTPWADQGETIRRLKAMDLPQDLKEKIFYKNAVRLLGL